MVRVVKRMAHPYSDLKECHLEGLIAALKVEKVEKVKYIYCWLMQQSGKGDLRPHPTKNVDIPKKIFII